MSSKSRLAILFFAISFLPSVVIGILTYNNYEKLYEKNELQSLDYIADYKLTGIDLYFSGLIDDAESMQSSWCIKENLPAIIEFSSEPTNPKFVSAKKILDDRFRPTQKTWDLLDIMMTDMKGRIVYATNTEHIHYLKNVPDPNEKSFKEGLKGVYVTDIFKDPAEGGRSKMLISVPCFTYDSSPIGVVIFEIDLAHVYKLIQDFTGLGNTGETLIAMKTDHGVIYLNPLRHDPNAALTRHIEIGGPLGVPIQNAVAGKAGQGYSTDYRGVKVIASWRYIPALRWGLVAKINAAEAFKDCYILKYTLFIMLGALFILCVIVSRMIAGIISKYRDHLEDLVKARTKEISSLNRNIEFILGATKTGLDIIDSDYNMVYIDPAWQKVYGDPKGKKCYEYFMGKSAPCNGCGVREAFEKKQPVVTEETLVKEGDRPIQVTTIPYQDEKGNWLVAEINVDISKIKRAEKELERYQTHLEELVKKRTEEVLASEERLRFALDASYTGAWDLDLVDHTAIRSIEHDHIFGYAELLPEWTYEKFLSHVLPDDREAVDSNFQHAIKTETDWNFKCRIRRADGVIRWIWAVGRHQRDTSGNVRRMAGIVQDITERRNAEIALEVSEANYRAIFELATDAIVIRDIESYVIIDANEQACELLCYPKEELLKLPPKALLPDEPPNNWEHIKPIYDKAAAGEPQSVEIMLKDKAQRTFWVEIHMKRAIISGTYRLLSIAHDISERKESDKQISELNNSIARANEELKELALIDSHTGLYNYHYYNGIIEAEFARAQRQDEKLSLIMMDIDYFKSINDVYGHQFGDLTLKQFAELLKKTVRLYDTVIRFGGEEFIIVAPGTGNKEALALAKRILAAAASFAFGDDEHKVKLKISAACGSYPDDSRIKTSSDFINIADFILGKAKEEGGNRAYSSLDYVQTGGKKLQKMEPDIASLKDKISKLTTRGNQSVTEAIFAFAKTIELKDRYTGAHVDDTMHYAVMIAEKLGLSEREVELTKYAAALHDLGKIGIPEAILHKTDKLEEEEFNIIKLHPQIGADIIRPIHFLHDIIPAILHHHEHWDGSGYPTGLKKESIPLASRIVAVADAYQAMVSDRPYRKALSEEEAIEELKKSSGIQFDPKIVSIFLNVIRSEKKSSKHKKK